MKQIRIPEYQRIYEKWYPSDEPRRVYGRADEGLSSELECPGSSPWTYDILTNYSSGQATNAYVSLLTKQCSLIPAS